VSAVCGEAHGQPARAPGAAGAGVQAVAMPYAIEPVDEAARNERIRRLHRLLETRIVFLDGAMGTMVQRQRPDEAIYRGARFADHGRDVRGNNEVLSLTQPAMIAAIHREYLEAGADIIETNTFSANAVSQADYGMAPLVPEMNYASARLARRVADEVAAASGEPRFVAGAIGPTTRTASLSPDVNDPGFRNVTFDDLAATYGDATRG
jgi:5-methyltetrahydrofolate--homocysteine methyltransferase